MTLLQCAIQFFCPSDGGFETSQIVLVVGVPAMRPPACGLNNGRAAISHRRQYLCFAANNAPIYRRPWRAAQTVIVIENEGCAGVFGRDKNPERIRIIVSWIFGRLYNTSFLDQISACSAVQCRCGNRLAMDDEFSKLFCCNRLALEFPDSIHKIAMHRVVRSRNCTRRRCDHLRHRSAKPVVVTSQPFRVGSDRSAMVLRLCRRAHAQRSNCRNTHDSHSFPLCSPQDAALHACTLWSPGTHRERILPACCAAPRPRGFFLSGHLHGQSDHRPVAGAPSVPVQRASHRTPVLTGGMPC